MIGTEDWRREFAASVGCCSLGRVHAAGDDTAVSWSSTASTVWIVDNAVVVGAGIGGLTASLLLSRVAARVTLVERTE